MQDVERQVDGFRRQEAAGGDAADGLEGPLGVSQVQEKAPARDHIERAELAGVEVVDRHFVALDVRPQQFGCEGESGALFGAGEPGELRPAARSQARRPVPLVVVGYVDGDDLGGATALHLEGQETVVGADVEAASSLDFRPRQRIDDRSQIEPSRCDQTRFELERVVPERVVGDPSAVVRRTIHRPHRVHLPSVDARSRHSAHVGRRRRLQLPAVVARPRVVPDAPARTARETFARRTDHIQRGVEAGTSRAHR